MITFVLNHNLTVIIVAAYIMRLQHHFCVATSFSMDLELIQRQQICSTEYWGILHREQYLPGKTKPNCQDSCEQIKINMSCCTLYRWPLIVLLGFLSLSFKNDSKKPATKIVSQGTAKLLNLIHIMQQSNPWNFTSGSPANEEYPR